jgi:hypothetical protein
MTKTFIYVNILVTSIDRRGSARVSPTVVSVQASAQAARQHHRYSGQHTIIRPSVEIAASLPEADDWLNRATEAANRRESWRRGYGRRSRRT